MKELVSRLVAENTRMSQESATRDAEYARRDAEHADEMARLIAALTQRPQQVVNGQPGVQQPDPEAVRAAAVFPDRKPCVGMECSDKGPAA